MLHQLAVFPAAKDAGAVEFSLDLTQESTLASFVQLALRGQKERETSQQSLMEENNSASSFTTSWAGCCECLKNVRSVSSRIRLFQIKFG